MKKKLLNLGFIDLLTKKAPKLGAKAATVVASIATNGRSDKILELFQKEVKSSTELSDDDKEIILNQMQHDLNEFEMEIQDAQNARDAEFKRQNSKNVFTRNMNTILAASIIAGAFGLVGILIFTDDIGGNSQTLVNVAFGAIFTAFTTVTGYYFGKSTLDSD
jgi:DNA-directed RNA polymerase beta subunit